MNFPNYSGEIRQFSLTARTDEKKIFFEIFQKSNIGILAFADISNFEKLTMKLYSLLISTGKKYIKSLKKFKLVLFSGRILPCKQNSLQSILYFIPQIPTSQTVGSKPTSWHMKAVTVNWCLIVRT